MQLREERQRECESVERGRRARRGRERSEFLSTDETSERRAESAPRGDMAGHHTEWEVYRMDGALRSVVRSCAICAQA